MTDIIRAGEVWVVTHSRKGVFQARFLEPFNPEKPDDFTRIEVVEGRAKFMSGSNADRGYPGDSFQVRNSMLTPNYRVLGAH
jgi:hypothetical protein